MSAVGSFMWRYLKSNKSYKTQFLQTGAYIAGTVFAIMNVRFGGLGIAFAVIVAILIAVGNFKEMPKFLIAGIVFMVDKIHNLLYTFISR